MSFCRHFSAAFFAMALSVSFTLTACGESGEPAAERIVENALAGGVNIEKSNVIITDERGNETVAGAGDSSLLNWPLPIPDSGSLAMATVQTDGTAYAMWVVGGSASNVANDYGQLLISMGYALDQETNLDGAIMHGYSIIGMFVSVVAGETDGETTIAVTGIPE